MGAMPDCGAKRASTPMGSPEDSQEGLSRILVCSMGRILVGMKEASDVGGGAASGPLSISPLGSCVQSGPGRGISACGGKSFKEDRLSWLSATFKLELPLMLLFAARS